MLRRLVGWSDVLVENFRPGTMARFGLDDQGARALLSRHAGSVRVLAVDDPGIHRDVDTPNQLAAMNEDPRSGL